VENAMAGWKSLLVLTLCVAGCKDFLAERMVAPPNGGKADDVATIQNVKRDYLQIQVGPPKATLAVWVLEPRQADGARVKGTVLVLHGFLNNHGQMMGVGQSLRDAGYRAVLVDLRGHGESTGTYITYGVEDARDLSQLLDFLEQRHLCEDAVGVYGASYGAASAILLAGRDPRVKAVVAVAPFASLQEEAPYFGKHILPVPGLFFSSLDYKYIVNRMGQVGGFDPDLSDPLAAIRKTSAHVRLFHGDTDLITPCHASEELAAAAPGRTELTILHGKGHLALCFDLFGELHGQTQAWFDRWLAGQ
jgi:pimeloyl-ACP methyl ester carboxylesterase